MIPIGKYRPTTCLFSVAKGVGSSDENSTTRPFPIARRYDADESDNDARLGSVVTEHFTSLGTLEISI